VNLPFQVASSEKLQLRGTHRTRAPSETVALAQQLAPRMGITRVANVTGLDRIGIPVVAVIRPNARSVSVAQGKGLDLAAAKASGLMEAIEGFHAETIALPLRFVSARELSASERVINTSRLAKTRGSVFDEERKLLWIEGRGLRTGLSTWLPYDTVHTDFTDIGLALGPTFFMSSNGLASGNHPLEAVNHALCELIERDAATLHELQTPEIKASRRVDLNSVDDVDCRAVLTRFAEAGIEVMVFDISPDSGVPCFRCSIGEMSSSDLQLHAPSAGFGCHVDRRVALLRGLLEAAQSRLTLIAAARDDLPRKAYDAPGIVRLTERFLDAARAPRPRAFLDTPDHSGDTLEGDLEWLVARVIGIGCDEPVVVDLSKPELGIPVARVVVPGLEAIAEAPGYVPGERARRLLRGHSEAIA
jgi:YcaO-like protein with predicted kinase domain